MKIIKCKQLSPEWWEAKKGHLSASNAQAIAANNRGLETYIYSLLAEKYSTNTEHYTNADMERGIELEEQARMTYEIENEKVKEVGFIEMDEYVGCSPDGLIGNHEGIEIKCPNDVNFFKLIVNGIKVVDSRYIWQVQMSMLVSERKLWKLVFYNPNFDSNMIIFRILPDLEKQEKLILGIEAGKKLIKNLERKYKYSFSGTINKIADEKLKNNI